MMETNSLDACLTDGRGAGFRSSRPGYGTLRRDERSVPQPGRNDGAGDIDNGRRGRIRFEDLGEMTREVVVHVAKCMRCTREEIVEGLNQ